MENIKKQIFKKENHFLIILEEDEAYKLGIVDGDVVQVEKCIVTPVTKVTPDDLDSYES